MFEEDLSFKQETASDPDWSPNFSGGGELRFQDLINTQSDSLDGIYESEGKQLDTEQMILDPALFYLQGTWHNYAKSNQMDPVGSLIAFKSYPRPGKISPTKIRFPRIRAFCKMEEKGMEGCTSPTASSPQFLRTVMNGPSIQETGDWDLIQGCPASR